MIQIIRSEQRHMKDFGWLQAHWHFSFGDYHDPRNVRWGKLRVFNDDWIQPNSGFPMHPHENMEIVTYVVHGELTHEDSLGNKGVIRPGEVQRMSAGTGIVHAEFNASATEPVHLMQMWVFPRERNLAPSWEQRGFTREERQGRLLPVVSGQPVGDALHMNHDGTLYISALATGDQVEHALPAENHAYLFVVEGDITLNGHSLSAGDQARITGETLLKIQADKPAELVLWDLVN